MLNKQFENCETMIEDISKIRKYFNNKNINIGINECKDAILKTKSLDDSILYIKIYSNKYSVYELCKDYGINCAIWTNNNPSYIDIYLDPINGYGSNDIFSFSYDMPILQFVKIIKHIINNINVIEKCQEKYNIWMCCSDNYYFDIIPKNLSHLREFIKRFDFLENF